MRKRQRRLVIGFSSLLAAAGLCFGAVSPAAATIEYPEGGTWEYGVNYWIKQVYSNYHHPSVLHNSTACNGDGKCTTSPAAIPGNWSYASERATWGGNTAYYNAG